MIKAKKIFVIVGVALSAFSFVACGGNQKNVADEQLTEPVYETQDMTVTTAEDDVQIIDGYEVFPMPDMGELFYVAKPHITRVKGVTYWGDSWDNHDMNIYKDINCPMGAKYLKQSASSFGWEFGTQPKFGLNKDEDKYEIEYNPLHEEMLGFNMVAIESSGGNADTEVLYKFCTADIQCVSMALYEDFYKDIPEFTFKVYGIPRAVWENALGNDMRFSKGQYNSLMSQIRENLYSDCILLEEKKMTTTGVYYIDYEELSKKGDFINYIFVGDFSKSCEYSYCVYVGDTYEIVDTTTYNVWKNSNIDRFIAGK